MLESLKNTPLPLESFPPMAQKALQPETPKPMKMMAAMKTSTSAPRSRSGLQEPSVSRHSNRSVLRT